MKISRVLLPIDKVGCARMGTGVTPFNQALRFERRQVTGGCMGAQPMS